MAFSYLRHIILTFLIFCGNHAYGWWLSSLIGERVQIQCYGEYGCFNTSYPWNNSQSYLPEEPRYLGVGFRIFTRYNVSVRLNHNVSVTELNNFIVPGIPTKILIHGFQDHGRTPWIIKMTSEYSRSGERMNLLSLDWKNGSLPLIYAQAVANIRLVAVLAAEFIKSLISYGIRPENLHLIGHSLGAHLAGYIGHIVRPQFRIFRITGLDPAAPLFEGKHPLVRLDSFDAIFVDVIHTYTDPIVTIFIGEPVGVGILQRCGTVDFYPNGGQHQPGCAVSFISRVWSLISYGTPNWKALKRAFGCSHLRALDLFTESINSNCTYTMYHCWSHLDISPSSCVPCQTMQCPFFGHRVDHHGFPGVFFFRTTSEKPFCT